MAVSALALWMLAQVEVPTRDEIRAIVQRLPAARDELVRFGPPVLRWLVEEPEREGLHEVVFELKCAGAAKDVRTKLERAMPSDVAAVSESLPAFARWMSRTIELPVLIDLRVAPEKVSRPYRFRLDGKSADRTLVAVLRDAGLHYAIVRGRVLISAADRLWSYPPERMRDLSEPEKGALQENVRKLGDDSLPARDEAAAAILGLGRSALPYLEEALRTMDPASEVRSGVVDLLARLRKRTSRATFDRVLALERQPEDDVSRVTLQTLRGGRANLQVEDMSLRGVLALLLRREVDVPDPAGSERLSVSFSDTPTLDAVHFVLASFELDACVAEGRVIVGTPSAIEKLVKGR